MAFDVSIALTWILFLALFPMAFFWLRNAWRIMVRRDFSQVALKDGESPADPAKFAPFDAAINLIAGGIAVLVILGVAAGELEYKTWTAIAGSTLWCKIIANFILRRHAHPIGAGRKR
jgi:hypothetical protein